VSKIIYLLYYAIKRIYRDNPDARPHQFAGVIPHYAGAALFAVAEEIHGVDIYARMLQGDLDFLSL